MKTASLYALAAAGVFAGGYFLAPAPARAADVGGSCCADLEQRVAELETSTVRKGNRKISLEIYGQVNRALVVWDDGVDGDAYVVDNDVSSSRAGFKGEGKIGEGWKTGFVIELGFTDSASNAVNNAFLDPAVGDEGRGESVISTRQAHFYIDSEQFGRVTLGHQNDATKDLTIINLSGAAVVTDARTLWNNSFHVRTSSGGKSVKWGFIADGLDSDRGDFIRYDSPSIYGFILTAAWGEDDAWDVALRFKKEWSSFRIAAGVGYYRQGDDNPGAGFSNQADTLREEVKGSISAMHTPTGLYVSFAAGERFNQQIASKPAVERKDAAFWYLQGGVDKRFFPIGNTTIYGEYGDYSGYGAVALASAHTSADLADSNVGRWGFGVVQKVDSAALELYAAYQHFEADLEFYTGSGAGTRAEPVEAWSAGIVGGRLKF